MTHKRMTETEALAIYSHPNGHTKEELSECLDILNASCQPVQLGYMQFEAVSDALERLGKGKELVKWG
ncbi:hypothetical protein LCGC14_1432710 [marine sediment metagenome]|uniref:Uncharacterized protein n=1 Tax=marine sediment metagenome TaxID=412755 RepID=A0A0F9K9A6_9ZZZZ